MVQRKKGSLNLSIQAIVILVMAMAVLGLGLSFIRILFDQGQGKLLGEIENINIMQASESQPISVTNTVKVRQGKYEQLQVSVYNKDVNVNTEYTIDSSSCTDASVVVSCPTTIDIPIKEQRNFGCAVTPASDSHAGLSTCQIKVTPESGNSLTASFFVEVTI